MIGINGKKPSLKKQNLSIAKRDRGRGMQNDLEKNPIMNFKYLNLSQKKQLLKKIGEDAYDNERIYHGCCRSVIGALQSNFHLKDGGIIQAATSLGGGVARTGEACGALLGGLMGIGLIYASDELDDSRTSHAYQETMEKAKRFSDMFKKEFGALRCHDVQINLFGRCYDLTNPIMIQKFRESDHIKCEDIVARKAAQLAAEVILEL